MRKSDLVEADQTKIRLQDTENGRTIIVSLWLIGTIATLSIWAGAFILGGNNSKVRELADAKVEEHSSQVLLPSLGPPSRAPGTWLWSELRGGECLKNFTTPFAEDFLVVSCESAHHAELLSATLISQEITDPYPGNSSVMAVARQLCDLSQQINIDKVAMFRDLRIAYSYPASLSQWERGERAVYCFLYSESRELFLEPIGPP